MKLTKKIIIILLFIVISALLIIIFDYTRINVRYFINKDKYTESFNIYGNKDGYVPQGLAYNEKYDIVLQTSYSKSISKIFITDFKSKNLIKELKLINKDGSNNNKHVGGIASYNSYIIISNDYELDIYDLDEALNTNNDSIKAIKEIKIPIRGDFCYYNNDIIWIGEFYLKPFYDLDDGNPDLYGYNVSNNINYNKPDYKFSLPKAVQGMSILPDGVFVFTQSYTYLTNSYLSFYKDLVNADSNKFNNKNRKDVIKLPPMAEGIFYKDGYLYILYESSSDKYFLADPKQDKIIKYKIEK